MPVPLLLYDGSYSLGVATISFRVFTAFYGSQCSTVVLTLL